MIHLRSRKLNLGCSDDLRPGYVNVDLQAFHKPDVVADVLDLRDFPSRHYEEIVALGLIEHFRRVDTRRALYEWNRLLIPGGLLELSTTYINGLARKLEAPSLQSIEGQELVLETMFAGQMAEGDYHLTAFTELLLRYYLWECGFDIDDIRLRDGWLFEVRGHKARDYSFVELLAEPDDLAFLAGAYREILYRDPDPTGLTHYGAALTGGQVTRPELLKQLLLCAERKQTMIGRAPTFPRVFDPCMALEDDRLQHDPAKRGFPSFVRRLVGRLLPGRCARERQVV